MDEQQLAAIERVKLVQKSSDVARRVAASRADASKAALRFMERGITPAHLGSEELWQADNACPSTQTSGRVARDALTECISPLAEGGLIGGVIPSALSSLLFAAYDSESRCPIERLPQPKVSVVRVLAHLDALGLSIAPPLAGQIARRATLVLLNHVQSRRPFIAPEERAHQDPVSNAEVPSAPTPSVEPEEPVVASPATVAGRQVRGYARVAEELAWAKGTPPTPVGTVVEVLVPDDRDRESLARDESRSAPSIAIWWEGRARIVPKSAMAPVARAEWNAWIKENGS